MLSCLLLLLSVVAGTHAALEEIIVEDSKANTFLRKSPTRRRLAVWGSANRCEFHNFFFMYVRPRPDQNRHPPFFFHLFLFFSFRPSFHFSTHAAFVTTASPHQMRDPTAAEKNIPKVGATMSVMSVSAVTISGATVTTTAAATTVVPKLLATATSTAATRGLPRSTALVRLANSATSDKR